MIDKLNIPIYYINLDKSIDRNNNILNQLKSIKNIKRIPGVVFDEQKKYKIDLKFYSNLTNSEKGCTLAHLNTIEQFLKDNHDYALICEDDVNFDLVQLWNFSLKNIISNLNKNYNEWTTCQLFHNYYDNLPDKLLKNFKLLKTKINSGIINLPNKFKFIKNEINKKIWYNTCYIINKKCAIQIKKWTNNFTVFRDFNGSKKVNPTADWFLYYRYDASPYVIFPSIILNNSKLFESTIHKDHDKKHINYSKINKIIFKKVYNKITF